MFNTKSDSSSIPKIESEKLNYLQPKLKIKWVFSLGFLSLHIASIYGLYLSLVAVKWQTIVVTFLLAFLTAIGTLVAAHRYYTHRSFKAKLPLRIILCILQSLSGQRSIVTWAVEHHMHHKYEGTNADTTSINRGFFYSHIGWLLIERHPEWKEKRSKLNVDYLFADPIVKFQYDYYYYYFILFNMIIPTIIPYFLFGETLVNGFFTCFALRHIYTFQIALCGNSVAHYWGTKEYDISQTATHNNILNYNTLGGAYHNYHHVFPSDYSASEFGWQSNFNVYTAFIDFFYFIGWAYDLKKTPQDIIDKRRERTGVHIEYNYYLKMYPILDLILGIFINSSFVWILFLIRMFTYQA